MQAYTIPSITNTLYPFLIVDTSNTIPPKCISQSLSFFLQDLKDKIHIHEKEWDNFKKYTNIYEYIHTNNPYKKRSVSKYKPLSRSYFKMIELIHEFRLIPCILPYEDKSSPEQHNSVGLVAEHSTHESRDHEVVEMTKNHLTPSIRNIPEIPPGLSVGVSFKDTPPYFPIRTFHLAEGPGGFIEAVVNFRKNPYDTYIGMTIQDNKNDGTIPTWKKSDHFLTSNPNIQIENGADGTGDILSIKNFEYCYHTYRSTMNFITADGGFDFSTDFNNQELQIVELLFAQIAFALVMQKPGGHFVLKIFDCFYNSTIDLLALLSSFYKTVYITKPQTSRSGNSEKYVVCKYFTNEHSAKDFYPYLHKAFSQNPSTRHPLSQHVQQTSVDPVATTYICRYLNLHIPIYFQLKLEEYNSGFGFHQIENIHNTLAMISRNTKPERIDSLIQKNIGKCIEWCILYNIPYNTFFYTNTFI
jgi:23S rRNA U2552 (ribose-2'-O)-methylase RlmE/FtsJ